MIRVRLPQILSAKTGTRQVWFDDPVLTVEEIVGKLETEFPTVSDVIRTADGALAPNMGFYVDDEDTRFLGGVYAKVVSGQELHLIPSVAGGCI